MNGQRVEADISDAMVNYEGAVRARQIAMFDVTQIEKLGVRIGADKNSTGTLVTFEYLRGLDETERNAILRVASNGYGVNFGMPKGRTWDQEQPPAEASE